MKKINLGCGHHYIENWLNLDFKANSPHVISHDLSKKLPLEDGICNMVYHSHVLEHLRPADAQKLLSECHRVLQEKGILRVVVPDLEQKARAYIKSLEEATFNKSTANHEKHLWMIIEMLDQMVRTRVGGEMINFVRSGRASSFVSERIGSNEYDLIFSSPVANPVLKKRQGVFSFLHNSLDSWARRRLQVTENQVSSIKFKELGENHLWMYDSVSLALAMEKVGFRDVKRQTAFSSYAKDWQEDGLTLDVIEGRPHHPDSIYIEGRK